MTVDEFDTALSDLETRVDRLRALYENWFRGYEKTEPGVARKDVERRVYGLRKELPRNTALRFRYHQLYQRYTTLATYWQRTARQIEEGTYRRQLQRIKRRRDDDTARTLAPPPKREGESSAPPAAYELNLDETLDVRNLLDDFDLDQVADALESAPVAHAQPAKRASLPSANVATPASLANDSAASMQRNVAPADVIGAVGGALGASAPRTSARFGRPTAEADVARPVARNVAATPANDVAAPASPTAKAPTPPPASPAARPMPPAVPAAAQGPGTGTRPMPPAPPPAAVRPVVPGAVPPIPVRRPVPPPPSVPSAAPAARPPAPPIPARAATPPAPSAAPSNEGLTEQRMRKIYEEYAAARRKNNEGDVRYETLAGSIQKMLPDLHKRHQGKQIDFEVVLKDGRVGLKPKAT